MITTKKQKEQIKQIRREAEDLIRSFLWADGDEDKLLLAENKLQEAVNLAIQAIQE